MAVNGIGRPSNPNMPPKTSGIYRFLSWVDGKIYVGSAVKIYQRRIDHIKDLRKNRHGNSYLQNAWNKYGENNFTFEVLELCSKDKLLEREQFYIDTLNCVRPNGYNLNPTAGSNLGRKFSDDFKEKARARQLGKTYSDETKQLQREIRLGIPRDPEIGKKISKAKKGKRTGKKHPPEQLAKMRLAQQARRAKELEKIWEILQMKMVL